MRRLKARARGISRKKTVSKNTGMESRNPLERRTKPARFSPHKASKARTTRSAAPLPIMQVPMMAAKATTKPMPPAVSPKPMSDQVTALFQLLPLISEVSNATRLWNKPLLRLLVSGRSPVIKPARKAARMRARKACTRNWVMATTMNTTQTIKIMKGQREIGVSEET